MGIITSMNNLTINFTKASPDALDEVFALFCAAKDNLLLHGIDQWDELYPDREILEEDICRQELYTGRIGSKLACVFVLNSDCDEEYINGSWTRPDASFCVVHRLCVNPSFQRMGIGRKTMLHIEGYAAQLGFDEIRLDTFSQNPFSIRLYESLGYKTVGFAQWRKGKFLLMEKKI